VHGFAAAGVSAGVGERAYSALEADKGANTAQATRICCASRRATRARRLTSSSTLKGSEDVRRKAQIAQVLAAIQRAEYVPYAALQH
jgi:hypothetical protein